MKKVASFAVLLALVFTPLSSLAQAPKPEVKTTPSAPLFQYALKQGETYKYRVTGLFHGTFPPFASPGAPPVNLRIVLDYAANVKKQDANSSELAFHIERADLFLLEAEPDKDGKLPPGKEEVNFPIPVEDVQKSLDVTATLKPDGTVTNVQGGNASSAQINFGIELRKMFLLMFPVAFSGSDRSGSAWKSEDGLLGKQPGSIIYESQQETNPPKRSPKILSVRQTGLSRINDMKDANNQTVTDEKKAATVNTGEAKFDGVMNYALISVGDKTRPAQGNLASATLNLTAKVHTKRTKPDPTKPEEPLETDVNVTAKLTVKPLGMATSAPKVKPASLPGNAPKGK